MSKLPYLVFYCLLVAFFVVCLCSALPYLMH